MNNLAIYEYLRQNDNSAIFNNTLPPILSSTTTIATEDTDTAEEKAILQQFLTGPLSAPYFFDDVHEIRDCLYQGRSFNTVTIPEGVQVIGKKAFANCKSLTTVTLPSTIQSIDKTAFLDSGTNLLHIIINQPTNAIEGAPWGANSPYISWREQA